MELGVTRHFQIHQFNHPSRLQIGAKSGGEGCSKDVRRSIAESTWELRMGIEHSIETWRSSWPNAKWEHIGRSSKTPKIVLWISVPQLSFALSPETSRLEHLTVNQWVELSSVLGVQVLCLGVSLKADVPAARCPSMEEWWCPTIWTYIMTSANASERFRECS